MLKYVIVLALLRNNPDLCSDGRVYLQTIAKISTRYFGSGHVQLLMHVHELLGMRVK